MELIFYLSGEHIPLAAAEVQSLVKGTAWARTDQYLRGEASEVDVSRLAFTKAVFEVIDPDSFILEGSLRIDNHSHKDPTEARKTLLSYFPAAKIDLVCPHTVLAVFDECLGRLLWQNTQDFAARKAHNRPCPHPTSLHPKLARALVNLSGAQHDVLDPFCGSGGLLLEAGLMGLECTGIDADEAMINRARTNLQHFGLECTLITGDARNHLLPCQAIVSDLPYGRNSKLDDFDSLLADFLRLSRAVTSTMVIALPVKLESAPHWTLEQVFSWPLHRSLTKYIHVLKV